MKAEIEKRIRKMQDSHEGVIAVVPNTYCDTKINGDGDLCHEERQVWEVVDILSDGLYEINGVGILGTGETIDEAIEAAYAEWISN